MNDNSNIKNNEVMVRPKCKRIDISGKFSKFDLQYKVQYSHIYYVRSQLMHDRVESMAKNKWGNDILIKKISELKPSEICIIIGTIFKSMKLQPSILKEISDETNTPVQPLATFADDDDKVILEDSQQRVALIGNITPGECYTGSVIACLGSENENGHFVVQELTYPGLPVQPNRIVKASNDCFVLILSGLGLGGKHEKTLQFQLLLDYVLGMLGGYDDHKRCSGIVHVIIAGNSLSKETLDRDSQTKAKYLTYKNEASTVKAMVDLDQFLSQLVPFVSVDLMCGEHDLSNYLLPQKPLHPCMLPLARKYHTSTFHTVSNPYECEINGIHFLGTSGQNINNMKLYSKVTDSIKLMLDTLELQHLSPTAPDTLASFPFYNADPFIIDKCPQVYFCGNQSKFDFKLHSNENGSEVLMVSVPAFEITSSAVLINLKDLCCEELKIDIDSEECFN